MPSNLTERERKLLFTLLFVIIVFLFWRIIVCRLAPELSEARLLFKLERSSLLAAQEKMDGLPFLQALAADLKNEVHDVEGNFWQQIEQASLIKVLCRAGGEGLQITSFQPFKEEDGGPEANGGEPEERLHCYERDYEIGIKGNTDAVLDFIQKLESEFSGRISFLHLQKDEVSPLLKGLLVWRIHLLPGEQKKEPAIYAADLFRQDLFEPNLELQTEYAEAIEAIAGPTVEGIEEAGENMIETRIKTMLEQPGNDLLFPEDVFSERKEPDYYYPDPYSFPFKN